MAASLETDNRDLIGRKVECSAERGAFKPCQWCGWTEGVVHNGTAQHAFQIVCAACGRGGRWVGRAEVAYVADRVVPEADVEVVIVMPAHLRRVFQRIVDSEGRPLNAVLIDCLRSGL